jgi:hypothetical protein
MVLGGGGGRWNPYPTVAEEDCIYLLLVSVILTPGSVKAGTLSAPCYVFSA